MCPDASLAMLACDPIGSERLLGATELVYLSIIWLWGRSVPKEHSCAFTALFNQNCSRIAKVQKNNKHYEFIPHTSWAKRWLSPKHMQSSDSIQEASTIGILYRENPTMITWPKVNAEVRTDALTWASSIYLHQVADKHVVCIIYYIFQSFIGQIT